MSAEHITIKELLEEYKLSEVSLDKEVTEDDIKKISLVVGQWELLALHLGLSEQQIEQVKRNNDLQEDVKRLCILNKWKETFVFKATYRKFLDASLSISRSGLACKVCEFIKTPPYQDSQILALSTQTSDTIPSSCEMSLPTPMSFSTVLVSTPCAVAEMEKAFAEVVFQVEESFAQNVPLERLQSFSCHLPADLKGQFGRLFEDRISKIFRTESVRELLAMLSYFWDYLHPHLLKYLVGRFEANCKELLDLMLEYEKKLTDFRKAIKIPDYIGERRINLDNHDYTPIIVIFGDEWCQKTLADLEEMRCLFAYKFSFLQLLPKMNGVMYNSIAVTLLIPKSVHIDHGELSEFFQSYDALKIMVGDLCIYDCESHQTLSDDQDDMILVDTSKPMKCQQEALHEEEFQSVSTKTLSDDQDDKILVDTSKPMKGQQEALHEEEFQSVSTKSMSDCQDEKTLILVDTSATERSKQDTLLGKERVSSKLPVTHEMKMAEESAKVFSKALTKEQKSVDLPHCSTIKLVDFFWDQLVMFISFILLALAGTLCFSLFIWDTNEVQCYLLPESATLHSFQRYEKNQPSCTTVSNYCATDMSGPLADLEYYFIFIVMNGIVLLVLHLTWNTLCKSQLNSFFRVVRMVNPLRNPQTGEYDEKNFDCIKKLGYEYGNSSRLFKFYVAKLFVQLGVCIIAVLFSTQWFARSHQPVSFRCPIDITLSDTVRQDEQTRNAITVLISNSFLPFRVVCYSHLILSILAGALSLCGIAWCFCRHTQELGHMEAARFSFQACLDSDSFTFPSIVTWTNYCAFDHKPLWNRMAAWIFSLIPRVNVHNMFFPRIKSDFDFCILGLFQASFSYGKVFKTVQIHKELKRLVGHEHQLLHLYINLQSDMMCQGHNIPVEGTDLEVQNFHDLFLDRTLLKGNVELIAYNYFKPYLGNESLPFEQLSGIREKIYWFVAMFGPNDSHQASSQRTSKQLAVDLSFGSIGYSLVLAKPFKRVLTLKFDEFFLGRKSGEKFEVAVVNEHYTNHATIMLPHDIFTQQNFNINDAFSAIIDFINRVETEIDFLLVGPIREEQQKVSVSLLLNMLYTLDRIKEDALLLTVRPLKVDERKLTSYYLKYQPSKQLFDDAIQEKIKSKLHDDSEPLQQVDEIEGVQVWCGQVSCVFEFSAYRFVGAHNAIEATNVPDKNKSPPSYSQAMTDNENLDKNT